ncbi:MAG: zinc-dependent alcohol dehydrogenase family protein, partial [Anaerolineae bacterium]|nr:zinc-dependent alcohol dehydrogenase family protein [Anaerolineae bacterium]
MKAAFITAPHNTAVMSAPEPQVAPNDVLIKVRAAGICGTDIHILKGEYEAKYPLIPGHEFSGEVTAVGADVTNFKVGDRVTADPNIPCNRCYFCQRNEPNQCRDLGAIGVTRNGAFAEYVVAPEGNVFAIGDMPYKAAALIEPLACVVWGLKQVEIQAGDSAVIFGAGPMGCLLVQAVKRAGAARIVIVDQNAQRLKLAAELGATEIVVADDQLERKLFDLEHFGYDVVVDATGVPAVIQALFAYAKPRAKVWIFGVAPAGARIEVVPFDIFRNDIKVIGSFAVNRTFPQSIALIQSG